MKYAIIKLNQVISVGSTDLTIPDLELMMAPGDIVKELDEAAELTADLYYYDGTDVVLIPPSPHPNYVFHFNTGTWEDSNTLAEAKLIQSELILKIADDVKLGGFYLNDVLFNSDLNNKINIINSLQAAIESKKNNTIFSANLNTEFNSIAVNADEMIRIGLAFNNFNANINNYALKLVNLIELSLTNLEVYAIEWELFLLSITVNTLNILADGIDQVVFENLPFPTEITVIAPDQVGLTNVTETDGDFNMTTSVPGKYTIIFSAENYTSATYIISAT